MATKLSLYKGALRIIKDRSVTALTDDEEARYLLDDEYDKVLDWALEEGLWNFATRTVKLEASTSIEPTFGFTYAFDQPDDYVRLVSISFDEYLHETLEDYEYKDEDHLWLADQDIIYVAYVSNDSTKGMDLANWPATFELMVEHELANRIAPHLTGFSAAELEALEAKRDKALRDARSKDALNQGARRPPVGRLVRSRVSRRAGGVPYWRR